MKAYTSTDIFLPVLNDGFTVGFSRFSITDTQHKPSPTPVNRPFDVLVWYPGESTTGMKRKAYLEHYQPINPIRAFTTRSLHIRSLERTLTQSFTDIPVSNARDRFPILLFSHDLGCLPEYYTILMESLAAEGYIIFSINHPRISAGSTSPQDPSQNFAQAMPVSRLMSWWEVLACARKFRKAKSYHEKWMLSRKIASRWPALASEHAEMMMDKSVLLDYLEKKRSDRTCSTTTVNAIAEKMDLEKIGVFGHGWGGSSAVHSLIRDRRIKAAVNIDGFQFANGLNDTITKPLAMIYSAQFAEVNEGSYFSSSDYDHLTLQEAKHHSFSDLAYLTGHRSMSSENLLVLIRTIDEVKSFFNTRLQNSQFGTFEKISMDYQTDIPRV